MSQKRLSNTQFSVLKASPQSINHHPSLFTNDRWYPSFIIHNRNNRPLRSCIPVGDNNQSIVVPLPMWEHKHQVIPSKLLPPRYATRLHTTPISHWLWNNFNRHYLLAQNATVSGVMASQTKTRMLTSIPQRLMDILSYIVFLL